MNKAYTLLDLPLNLYFPLEKYGYILERALNNENRWHTKIVCSILDRDSECCVSTTYARKIDYLKHLEILAFLKRNNKLSPTIIKLFPEDNTLVCNFIGKFLSDYLLNNPIDICPSLTTVFDYLKDINSINQENKIFIIPSIVRTTLELSKQLTNEFEFLPRARTILPKLQESNIKFSYGCGIEDPHIWNFRIIDIRNKLQGFTTDFDFFSDRVNYFWQLGYFYATFRWLKKVSLIIASKAEKKLPALIKNQDLKSKFMFWLGVLSSYCGYRDSLLNFITNGRKAELQWQSQFIQELDEKIFYLTSQLLKKVV